MQLEPKTYNYKYKGKYESYQLAEGQQYGFIAQELEKTFPEMVKEEVMPYSPDKNKNPEEKKHESYKSVNYQAMIPLLVKAVQEQQEMITMQQEKIEEMETRENERMEMISSMLSSCCQENAQLNNDLLPSDTQFPELGYLQQNTPNPFSAGSMVSFFIPKNFVTAELMVADLLGRVWHRYPINEAGNGNVYVEGNQFTPGTYNCTLFVNGQVADNAKMIIVE